MVEKYATGGYVRLDAVQLDSIASDITAEPSRWVAPLPPVVPPEGVTVTLNLDGAPERMREALADWLRLDIRGGRKPEAS